MKKPAPTKFEKLSSKFLEISLFLLIFLPIGFGLGYLKNHFFPKKSSVATSESSISKSTNNSQPPVKASSELSNVEQVSRKPEDLRWLKEGVEYKYYNDSSCSQETDKQVCMSRDNYFKLCQKNPSFTDSAVRMLGLSNSDFKILSEVGIDYLDYVINDTNQSCEVVISTSGIIRGSSKRITIHARPGVFRVNSEGKIFVTYAFYLYGN
jgi:hypothetical protein